MNTCLSVIYLKLSKIDSQYIRMTFMALTLILSVGVVMGLPIAGDVCG